MEHDPTFLKIEQNVYGYIAGERLADPINHEDVARFILTPQQFEHFLIHLDVLVGGRETRRLPVNRRAEIRNFAAIDLLNEIVWWFHRRLVIPEAEIRRNWELYFNRQELYV